MKQNFLGLRTCIYKVTDVGKAKAWYSKVFSTDPYFDQPFYVGFNIAGYELGLQPTEDNSENKTESVETYWGVEDIHASYKWLIENNAKPHQEPTDVGESIMVATVKDPWNNLVGIIYNPHFKLEQ